MYVCGGVHCKSVLNAWYLALVPAGLKGEGAAENGSAEGEDTMEERLKKLKLGRRGGRRSDGKALGNKEDVKKEDGKKPKKTMRNWNSLLNGSDGEEKPQKLNFSSDLHKVNLKEPE